MKNLSISVTAFALGTISLATQAVDCTGLEEWDSQTAYHGASKVQEADKAYTANWWSYGSSPATHSGQWQEWTLDGECEHVNHAPVAVITYLSSDGSSSSSASSGGMGYVTLDGSQSTDADGDALTYSWDGVNFSDVTTKTVRIGGWYDNCHAIYNTFTLTVKDIHGATGTAQTIIQIAGPSGSPSCSSSTSSSASSSSGV